MSPETMLIVWTIISVILAVVVFIQGCLIYKLMIKVLRLLRENEQLRKEQ